MLRVRAGDRVQVRERCDEGLRPDARQDTSGHRAGRPRDRRWRSGGYRARLRPGDHVHADGAGTARPGTGSLRGERRWQAGSTQAPRTWSHTAPRPPPRSWPGRHLLRPRSTSPASGWASTLRGRPRLSPRTRRCSASSPVPRERSAEGRLSPLPRSRRTTRRTWTQQHRVPVRRICGGDHGSHARSHVLGGCPAVHCRPGGRRVGDAGIRVARLGIHHLRAVRDLTWWCGHADGRVGRDRVGGVKPQRG